MPWAPRTFLNAVLRPGCARLASLDGPPRSPQAERLLLAIALQESGLAHRVQVLAGGGFGAARGWWQFEPTGVRGVLNHAASAKLAAALCAEYRVRADTVSMWRALEGHDLFAAGLARLLLFTDPHPLPHTQAEGWSAYLRLWRPGKPRLDAWAPNWVQADQAIGQTTEIAGRPDIGAYEYVP